MKKNRPIALISAVPLEGSHFIKMLKPLGGTGQRSRSSCCPGFYAGRLFGCELLYVSSGMGKVNAAHATTLVINCHSPSLVINFGIGGAYPSSGLAVGDVAIATKEIYADEGVWLKEGLQTLETTDIPLVRTGRRRYYNEFPLINRQTKKFVSLNLLASWEQDIGASIRTGPFATVSACTGTNKRAEEIEKRFGVICENMEGAAVAHICALYGISLIEVRGISNIVEERNRASWNIAGAAENCQDVVMELLKKLSKSSLIQAC
ncbi:MAG: futalosine hydrolase [Thermodesulfovibrio sp.]|nr:futalosine hydrolase [Thermodesulfovibrio sp.]